MVLMAGGAPRLRPPRPLRDDFARPNTRSGLGVAPTGQTWYQLGSDTTSVHIEDGRYVTAPTAETIYQGIDLGATPVRMWADVSFIGTHGPNSAVALLCSNGRNGVAGPGLAWKDLVHPTFAVAGAGIDLYQVGVREPLWFGSYPCLPGVTAYDATYGGYVLLTDGTIYRVTVLIDLPADTVSISVRCGDVELLAQALVDARWRAVAGPRLIYQIFLGGNDDPTQDVFPRFESVGATPGAARWQPDRR